MARQVPMVDYLVLDDGEPHLVAHECASAAPGSSTAETPAPSASPRVQDGPIPTEGTVRAFTIVAFAAPGVPVPFVAASSTATARACGPTWSTSSRIPSTSAAGWRCA